MREWALHHLSVGATKLYIYEHNSSRPALPEIQDLVDAGAAFLHHLQVDMQHGGGMVQA